MKTIEMEIAIMRWMDYRQNLIVPNVSWGLGLHECDLLSLSSSGYATEVEIKISKTDLLKDEEKIHGHVSKKIKKLYFAVPSKLKEIALDVIPDRAGLLIVSRNHHYADQFLPDKVISVYSWRVEEVKKPVIDYNALKWTDDDRMQLARLGCLRIHGLKLKQL